MAKINFDFVANADGLLGEVDKVSRELSGGVDEVKKFGKAHKVALGVVAAAAAAAAASVALLAKETLRFSANANQIAKTARQFGTTTKEVQRVDGALALLTDGSVQAATVARFLGKNLADARADGIGPAAEALEALGLAAEDVIALPLSRQIELIGSRFGGLRDNAERTQVSMDLLGRAGSKLLPVFAQGAGAFADAADQIEAAGIVTGEAAAQAEGLEDAIELMSRKFGTLLRDVVVPFVPVMGAAAEKMGDFVKSLSDGGIVAGFGSGIANVAIAMLGLTDEVKAFKEAVKEAEEAQKSTQQVWEEANAATREQAKVVAQLEKEWKAYAGTTKANEHNAKKLAEAQQELAILTSRESSALSLHSIAMLNDESATNSAARAAELKANADAFAAKNAARHAKEEEDLAAAIKAGADAADEAAARRTERIGLIVADIQEEVEAERAASLAIDRMNLERHQNELARLAELKQERHAAAAAWISGAATAVSSVGAFVTALTDLEVSKTEEGSNAREAALKRAWEAQTAVDIAMAAINIPLAISQAAAAPWPAAIGFMIAAGAAATAAFGGVVAKAAAGPSFHDGGILRNADLPGSAGGAGEISVRAKVGEGFLSTSGVAAAGGEAGVNALNRGEQPGGGQTINLIRFGTRTTEAIAHQQLKPTTGRMARAFRGVRPKLGRSIPGRR